MDTLMKVLSALCLIGALNWGLVGLFNFDLVAFIFGAMSVLSRLVYSLVGISAVVLVILAIRNQMNS
ncbi:MAG: DUF378 domain-containing protein [Alphaproteobacteria bacterium]|nr:DUF378 domain-containing protein [Alphaproteobacteria bacterium]MBQ8557322.1 DUF378 domain-containing protein [Alphaproteobacteria bacterium]MBR3913092.1 DUF378 domain-containing protein [Alphaproteobacteria bacterium]